MSKLSASEKNDNRKIGESNDDTAITTTTATTNREMKSLTPFQAQRVLLIGKLRELVINGHSPLAIQAELDISQRQYYRLYQKAFKHDCKLIEQWDSDTLREELAIYRARRAKILAFFMDTMQDPNAHDMIRLKAAQLATELSNAIYQSSSEGIFQVRSHVRDDMDKWSHSFPLHSYMTQKGISFHTLAQYKEAQRQLDKEEEAKNKTKGRHNPLADESH